MSKAQRNVDGFALASAIFLLVILAALGAFIVNISTQQQVGAALDVQGERAYQAAYAGMEWSRYQVWNNGACPANTTWDSATMTLQFTGTQTLTSLYATVECRSLASTDVSGVSTSVYELRVTACNKPHAGPVCPSGVTVANNNSSTLGFVERQLTGLVSL